MSTAANSRAAQGEEINEAPGAVASDSLAAESIRSGGGFSENPGAPLDQPGSGSTLNTTDTSAATVLQPARDGTERERQDAKALGPDERGTAGGATLGTLGDPNFTGTHSDQGYRGGPSGTSTSQDQSSNTFSSGATGDSFASGALSDSTSGTTTDPNIKSPPLDTYPTDNDAPLVTGRAGEAYGTSTAYTDDTTAPNYAGVVSGAIEREGQFKPKGDNLTEGGIPETKTFTGNVGGSKDPGRLASQGFERMGDSSGLVSAGAVGGGGGESGGKFDVLQSERAPDANN